MTKKANDLIIQRTGDKYLIRYGLPSAYGLEATVVNEYVNGDVKATVWMVNCDLTPEMVQEICRQALGQM